ncbi:MAG TPA: HAD family phosphatase [Lachnospiraceae bacterium]|nr:HAD family phosphatase [Lachnospiraceae bacterium]
MIKTIIFDIGNVLVEFDWQGYLKKFNFSEQVNEKIAEATVRNDAWDELDRGVLTFDEMIKVFISNDPTIEEEIQLFFENVNDMLKQYSYTIPWIKKLKENGYQVLVLSNFPENAHKQCEKALNFLEYIDGGILSYQEKLIKPDPAIYQLLIDKYQLNPMECVFLDDRACNLEAAKEFGIATILFFNQKQAMDELVKLGVNHD